MTNAGRAPRKEKDPQGPREEENNLHSTIRECDDDGWEEEGTSYTRYRPCWVMEAWRLWDET
jgi:hypothetical protein